MDSTPSKEDLKAHALKMGKKTAEVRGRLRVTKIVATRCIKTGKGDFFCGMSAAFASVQDAYADTEILSDEDIAASGMTLADSKIAHVLLSQEAAVGAFRAAHTEGAISTDDFDTRVKQLKRNTFAHLQRLVPMDEAKVLMSNAEETA